LEFVKRIIVNINFNIKDLLRGRIISNSIFSGICLMIFCYISTKFTYGVPSKIAIDVGAGLLTVSSLVLALTYGVNLISQEVDTRTIYMVLSRGVSRTEFLFCKIMSLIIVLMLNIFILSFFSYSTFWLFNGTPQDLIFWSFAFIACESVLVMMLAVFFALIVNKTFSILLSITFWIAGHSIDSIINTIFVKDSYWIKTVLTFYSNYFPNFNRLNLKDYVLYDQNIEPEYLYGGLIYTCLYLIAIFIIMSYVFKKKNFD